MSKLFETPHTAAQTTAQTSPQTTSPAGVTAEPQTPAEQPRALATRQATDRQITWLGTLAGLAAIMALIAMVLSLVSHGTGAAPGATTNGNTGNASSSSSSSASTAQYAAPAHQTYDATLPAVPAGNTVNVKLTAEDKIVSIANGIAYHAMTFNGTVPAPIIHLRVGQTVNFSLLNKSNMAHSIDFHAALTPWNLNYQAVAPGKSESFSFTAQYPGAFLYHCGVAPMIEHIANGMYGAIIVDPAGGWPTPAAKSYVLVQGEFYTQQQQDGSYAFNYTKAMSDQPDYVVFNGYANQYKDAPLTAGVNQRVRIFIINAGPNEFSAFHTVGTLFRDVYIDGNPANHQVGNQTITVPPGGGSVVEMVIPDAGQYPIVSHKMTGMMNGALAILSVK